MTPTLTHVADFLVEVGQPIAVGETAQGLRRVVCRSPAGLFAAQDWRGRSSHASTDFQFIGPDGFTRLEARYVVRLADGAMLYVENCGVRFGPPELMARIVRGEPVDPTQVYFRSTPRFETAQPAYQWLTWPLFIASGVRHPARVDLSVFEVG